MKKLNVLLFVISLLAIILLYLDLTRVINILQDAADIYALSVGLLIPLSLLFLGYIFLRDLKKYILWLLLAVGMLFFYSHFKDAGVLQMQRGTALKSFKSLFGFLLVFQISRQAFIRLTGREYVTPSKGGGKDLFEDRIPETADFIMFAILFFSILVSQEI